MDLEQDISAPTVRQSKHDQRDDYHPAGGTDTGTIIVEKLIAWGVETVFGLIGDGINPLLEALRKNSDRIRFVGVRHEEAAAFMAGGTAKFSGRLGCCIATTGPGAIHLMNGLFDASMDGAPVIVITGTTYHDMIGTQYMQGIDTVSLMKDLAVYNQLITGPRHAMKLMDMACRAALGRRGVAHLSVPIDTQQMKLRDDDASEEGKHLMTASYWTPPLPVPPAKQLQGAADLLNEGKKIMILAGRGALPARIEVETLAQTLGAPVTMSLLGRTTLNDDCPYSTGGIGHLGTLPSKELMHECDTLLILGSCMPYQEYYPKDRQARCVQIDLDPGRIGLRYPAEVGLTGDVKETLLALIPLLKKREGSAFLEEAQKKMKRWNERLEANEKKDHSVRPQYVVSQLNSFLKPDAMITLDCGAHTFFGARHLRLGNDQQLAVGGNLASMAPGLPYAIAAQIAFPDRQAVALVGDGGLTMLMGELSTAAKLKLPIRVIVFKNNALSMVGYEQRELGNREFGVELSSIAFDRVAEACGVRGFVCKDPKEVRATFERAFAEPGPALIEMEIDPREPLAYPEDV